MNRVGPSQGRREGGKRGREKEKEKERERKRERERERERQRDRETDRQTDRQTISYMVRSPDDPLHVSIFPHVLNVLPGHREVRHHRAAAGVVHLNAAIFPHVRHFRFLRRGTPGTGEAGVGLVVSVTSVTCGS